MDPSGTITRLLTQARNGNERASDQLFDRVYADLKRIAARVLSDRNCPPDRLSSTALVSAACERLLEKEKLFGNNRRQFFYTLSRAMRDVLVEQARSDLAAKRGGRLHRVPFGDFEDDPDLHFVTVLDIHQALDELAALDQEAADAVMLRFFGGRSLNEIAALTGVTFAVARRNWEYARAWLHERLSGRRNGAGPA